MFFVNRIQNCMAHHLHAVEAWCSVGYITDYVQEYSSEKPYMQSNHTKLLIKSNKKINIIQ